VTHDQDEALTMSDRDRGLQRGPDRAGRRPGRDLRAAGNDVRRRLRRRLQPARARRARFTVRPRRSAARGSDDGSGLHTERGRIRDVAYAGMITRTCRARRGGELQSSARTSRRPPRRRSSSAAEGDRRMAPGAHGRRTEQHERRNPSERTRTARETPG
jgi:hypothetical protein